MAKPADFSTQLGVLCATEFARSDRNADQMGVVIERLAAALGFAIAIAARGNAEAVEELLTGAEGYAHAEAVSKSRLVKLMFTIRPRDDR